MIKIELPKHEHNEHYNSASIKKAIASIGTKKGSITLKSGRWVIDKDIEIPANIDFIVVNEAKLEILENVSISKSSSILPSFGAYYKEVE